MSPKLRGKGISLMGMALAVLGVLIVGALVLIVYGRVASQMGFQTHCPIFCKLRYQAEQQFEWTDPSDYGPADIPAIPRWSEYLLYVPTGGPFGIFGAGGRFGMEWLGEQISDPGRVGCHCGVEIKSGKYLHARMDSDDDKKIFDFHLTNQPPSLHNTYKIPGNVDHRSDCYIGKGWDRYGNISACLIFSVEEGADDCTLLKVASGASITGKDGDDIEDEISWEKIEGSGNIPLKHFEFGKRYKFGDSFSGQRALLELPREPWFILWPTNLTCTNQGGTYLWVAEGVGKIRPGEMDV